MDGSRRGLAGLAVVTMLTGLVVVFPDSEKPTSRGTETGRSTLAGTALGAARASDARSTARNDARAARERVASAAAMTPRAVVDARSSCPGEDAARDRESRRARALQVLARVDWRSALADLVVAIRAARTSGVRDDANAFALVEQVNRVLAEAGKELGLETPVAALGDPAVRARIVPDWLSALGVRLEPGQTAAIASACLTVPSPREVGSDATLLDARLATLESRRRLEDAFGQVLSPTQMNDYYAGLADDPLMAPRAPRMSLSGGTPAALADSVAGYWTSSFGLGASSREAVQEIAERYTASVVALAAVPPNLGPAAARALAFDRSEQLALLQKQAEEAIAASPALTDAEKCRVAIGSRHCLKLTLTQ